MRSASLVLLPGNPAVLSKAPISILLSSRVFAVNLRASLSRPNAMQLLCITLKAGCTKVGFDATMAVHPTAAEELVTIYAPTYRIKNGERL